MRFPTAIETSTFDDSNQIYTVLLTWDIVVVSINLSIQRTNFLMYWMEREITYKKEKVSIVFKLTDNKVWQCACESVNVCFIQQPLITSTANGHSNIFTLHLDISLQVKDFLNTFWGYILKKRKLNRPEKYQCFSSDRVYVSIRRRNSRLDQFHLPKKCVLREDPTQSLKNKMFLMMLSEIFYRKKPIDQWVSKKVFVQED